ncbi:MAG: nuclear transport factor 2 family protein [Pseudomonadota bacterium]
MKRVIAAAMALIFTVSTGLANDSLSAADAVMAQEKAWARALLADDLDTVSELMHPDFRLIRTYSDAPPINKEAYLGMTGMSADAVEVTSADIEVVGGVAVAQATWSLDWSQEGVGKLPPHYKLTDVWLKGADGTWRIISRVSQIDDAPPAAQE